MSYSSISSSQIRVEVQPSPSVVRPIISKTISLSPQVIKINSVEQGTSQLTVKKLTKEEIKRQQEKRQEDLKREKIAKHNVLRPSLTALIKRGEEMVEECRDEEEIIKDDEKKKKITKQLLLWCHDFRTELVLSGLAMTIRSGAKSTITAGSNGGHELDYLVYQVLSIIDSHGKRRSNQGQNSKIAAVVAANVSEVVPLKPGPEPIKNHKNANEQRERLRWILSFVYHKCKGTQPSEVLRLQHNLSLILRRWLDESKNLRENILFFQTSPLHKFEAEEQYFRKVLTKLKSAVMRTGTEQDKHNVNCFESDGIACHLLKLECHFDLCQAVEEEERKLFISLVARLNKLEKCFNTMCKDNIERWRQVAKENVVFADGSVLHKNSLRTEARLQERVMSELCNMAFVIFSTMYSIALGGHVNTWFDNSYGGEVYIPFWWPSIWMTHSILILSFLAACGWNFFENGPDCNEVTDKMKSFSDGIFSVYYYKWTGAMGFSKHFASMILLVGIACFATVLITAATLRGIATASLLF
eukprot:g1337.t1